MYRILKSSFEAILEVYLFEVGDQQFNLAVDESGHFFTKHVIKTVLKMWKEQLNRVTEWRAATKFVPLSI